MNVNFEAIAELHKDTPELGRANADIQASLRREWIERWGQVDVTVPVVMVNFQDLYSGIDQLMPTLFGSPFSKAENNPLAAGLFGADIAEPMVEFINVHRKGIILKILNTLDYIGATSVSIDSAGNDIRLVNYDKLAEIADRFGMAESDLLKEVEMVLEVHKAWTV